MRQEVGTGHTGSLVVARKSCSAEQAAWCCWTLMGCAGLEVWRDHHMLVAAAVEDKEFAVDIVLDLQRHPYDRAQECRQGG